MGCVVTLNVVSEEQITISMKQNAAVLGDFISSDSSCFAWNGNRML